MIFLTIFLIILGRCFCWFLWAFLDCYWILWILTLQDRSSFNLVHEDVLKKVMILLQKGIQPIFCSFGNCCFCVLTSEDWDALSALYWSTFYEILVTQNLLGNLRFLYFLKTNVCDVSTKHFYQKDFFYCTILGIQLGITFIILKLGIKVYLIMNKRWVNFCNFVERTTMIKRHVHVLLHGL